MNEGRVPHRWSLAVYRLLVRALPRPIARAHGEEMVQAFGSLLREAVRKRGLRGFVGTWASGLVDLVRSAIGGRADLRRTRGSHERSRHAGGSDGHAAAYTGGLALGDDLWGDARLAARRLARAPLFTVSVVATLGLGIGVNTSTFQVVNELLRRPLPYPQPDQLVLLTTEAPELDLVGGKVSQEMVWEWRDHVGTLESVATFDPGLVSLGADDLAESEVVRTLHVTPDLFTVLQVEMHLGRPFLAEEGEVGSDHVAVLAHGLWQRRYAGSKDVIGRTITVEGRARTIVGVLPEGFEDPLGGLAAPAGLYLPLAIEPGSGLATSSWLFGIGRLAPEGAIEQARSELAAHWSALSEEDPSSYPPEIEVGVTDLTEAGRGDVVVPLRIALGATIAVLLIVCANLCGLLLARGANGGRDIAIRTAIGGSRYRVIRQMLVESAALAGAGGLVGLGVALSFASTLEGLIGVDVPRLAELSFDRDVFGFMAGISVLCAIAFGGLPALQLSRSDPQEVLKASEGLGGGHGRRRSQDALVVSQMAFATVLVVGAGLLLRSFTSLSRIDPGFEPEGVLTFELLLPSSTYPDAGQLRLFHDELRGSLAGLPGITHVGATNKRPLGTRWGCRALLPEGREIPRVRAEWPCGESHIVTPGYFQAMGISALRGRTLQASDGRDGVPVAVVSAALADRLWPGEEPLGKRVRWASQVDSDAPALEVVGVVAPVVHQGLHLPPAETLYEPLGQVADRRMTYAMKVVGDPTNVVPDVREIVRARDPTLELRQLDALDDVLAAAIQPYRVASLFLMALGVVGLLLSMTGVYALVSGRVSRRVREIGLRIALGASPDIVVRAIVRQGVVLGLLALAIGLAGAMLIGRAAASVLFEVSPGDPTTLASAATLILAVAALAAYAPARRASRVDPTEALRDG